MSPDPAADDFHYIYINMCVLNSPTKVFIESQWRLQEPVFWLIQCCNVLHVLNAEGASAGPNRWWPSNLPYQPRRLMILMPSSHSCIWFELYLSELSRLHGWANFSQFSGEAMWRWWVGWPAAISSWPLFASKKDRMSNIYSFVLPTAVKPFFQNF
jgi:hypothetical protein